jgi:putative ABC transport system permease protein
VAFDPRTGGDASAGGDTLLVPLRPQAAGVDWGAVERMLGAVAPESLSTPGAWTGRGVSDMVTVECGNCVRGTLLLPMYGVHAIVHAVSPGFFDGAGIAVLEGRGFEPGDAGEAPRVAVVSVPFRRHFEGGRPLGKRILLGGGGDRWVRVVGVVEPLPYQAPGSATPEQPVLYVPLAQHPAGEVVWARPQGREPLVPVRAPVRTAGEAATLRAVRAEARAPVRWVGRALLTAGALGLVLALAGAAEVARAEARGRWREAAVRASLGAPPRRLALRFLRRVAGTAVLGAGIGWILAWGVVGSVGRGASIRPLEGALLAALLFAASLAGAARAAGRVATADPAVLMRDGG